LFAGRLDEDIKLGNFHQRNQLIGTFCVKALFYRWLGSAIIQAMKEGAKVVLVNNESANQFITIIYRERKISCPQLKRICLKFQRRLSPACPQSVPSLQKLIWKELHLYSKCYQSPQSMKELMVVKGNINRMCFRRNILKALLGCKYRFVELVTPNVVFYKKNMS